MSDNGGVTRGICKMGEDNNLTEVVETMTLRARPLVLQRNLSRE